MIINYNNKERRNKGKNKKINTLLKFYNDFLKICYKIPK